MSVAPTPMGPATTAAGPASPDGWASAGRVVLVLGCRVEATGRPSAALRRRLAEAREAWQAVAGSLLVVSGGRVSGPTSEAQVMAAYLRELGVPAGAIVLEGRARSTRDNVRYSWPLVVDRCGAHLRGGGRCQLVVVTERFHLRRGLRLMDRLVAASLWSQQVDVRGQAADDALRGAARWARWWVEWLACARDLRWLRAHVSELS